MEGYSVDVFFQTAIYVTNATSIPVKLFSMYIIVFHAPKHLQQFRYAAICHSHRIKNMSHVWGYVYCVCFHVLFTVFYILLVNQWELNLSDYPIQSEIFGKTNLFCYNPEPKNKLIYASGLSFIFLFFGIAVLHAVFFSFRQMKKNEQMICKETIKAQKTVLWNLVMLSSVPIVMGVLPLLIGEIFVYFRYFANAKLAFGILMIVMLNLGTVYGILTLYLFKDYRRAVKRMFLRCVGKGGIVSNGTITVVVRSITVV
ncbi:hypothetical protein L596_009329 [Steinernema carpocapsae]|uniref:G-protein coupled receptors family 1 profile domain-containing protein n=1 Tax=Steinernema carpocapsae TaxID=34508 RepID=A0A4U5PF14_STECR|nr:hypothetical protein L596_009329 [Steinernema carpocapsae]